MVAAATSTNSSRGRLHRGDSSGAVVGISQSGYHYFLFGGYEGTCLAFIVYDPGCVEEVLHIEGNRTSSVVRVEGCRLCCHAQVHAEA